MTLTGRNITVRSAAVACFLFAVLVVFLFVRFMSGESDGGSFDMGYGRFFAIAGASITVLLGFLLALLYMRLFRRSPSIPVFFMSLFFLSMTLDVSKLGQVFVHFGPWPQLSSAIARVSLFGHITGALSLFAAGLYAGGIRMQRHGTVIFVGVMIAFSLSWLIPVDTSYLPDHLVYSAGLRASFGVALGVIIVLGIINFLQAAIAGRNPRLVFTAFAAAAIAAGREMLFYYVDPFRIIVGVGLVIIGATVFTAQHYRDYLVS